MNDNNIMACILFAKSQGLVVADEAITDFYAMRSAISEAAKAFEYMGTECEHEFAKMIALLKDA